MEQWLRQQAINDVQTSLNIRHRGVRAAGAGHWGYGNPAFKANVKGTRNGKSIDGDYRGVRTWAK
jgi:hypothetical protein